MNRYERLKAACDILEKAFKPTDSQCIVVPYPQPTYMECKWKGCCIKVYHGFLCPSSN